MSWRRNRQDDGSVSDITGRVREGPRTEAFWKASGGFFLATEPFWILGVGIGVYLCLYLSYLDKIGPLFSWLGLVVAGFPFFWRLFRYGYHRVRTPFDLPLALLVAGAVVGLGVSPDLRVSIRAFQSILAVTLVYYSFCNYPRPHVLAKAVLPVAVSIVLAAIILAFSQTPRSVLADLAAPWMSGLINHLPGLPQTSSVSSPIFGPSYGLAFLLLVACAFCVGFVIFGKGVWLRLGIGGGCLFLAVVIALFNYVPIMRLAGGESIETRIILWRFTIDRLKDSPLVGLGLGSWPIVFYQATGSFYPGHPHNAYLELYADTGILGLLAFSIFLVVGGKLGWDILRSPRAKIWYGVGMGILFAGAVSALFGLIEKAPIVHLVFDDAAYFYVFSPLPWLLGAGLVVDHRLVVEAKSQGGGQGELDGEA